MPEYHTLEDLEHAPDIAVALGNMVVAWAYADLVLIMTSARITGIDLNMAQAGYHRIPTFESRIKYLKAVAEEWEPLDFDRDAIVEAIDKLAKLARTRNNLVHGDWCISDDRSETVIFNMRAKEGTLERRKPVKAHDINHHRETVISRADELSELARTSELCD